MSDSVLYFPFINVPKSDWLLRNILYYDRVAAIVPEEYKYNPDQYDPFMLEMVQQQLVDELDPLQISGLPSLVIPFTEFIHLPEYRLTEKQQSFLNDNIRNGRISSGKFDGEIFTQLERLRLAKRKNSREFEVEADTASYLMAYLAYAIGHTLNLLPVTDQILTPSFMNKIEPGYDVSAEYHRTNALKKLIPYPEEFDLRKVLSFKEKFPKELAHFRSVIEQIALDPMYSNVELFNAKLAELNIQKDNLVTQMKEAGKFKNILFGSVLGVAGAAGAFATSGAGLAALFALPGFLSTVHSVRKRTTAASIFDQSGMKMLSLYNAKARKKI